MKPDFQHFGIIGGGAWGTALASALTRSGRHVTVWSFEAAVAASINDEHENKTYLPGVTLDAAIKATSDLHQLAACDAVVMVAPAQHVRGVLRDWRTVDGAGRKPILIASKGIEDQSMALLSDVVKAEMPQAPIVVLSGPSFASEVAKGLPAALTLATADKHVGEKLIQSIANINLRLYQTDDIIGAQIGGAVKNVLAVACGIISGRAMGDNARAALITRGLAELVRLGLAMGGRAETLMGLSGLGDLVLTCSSTQSRNMSLGMALGRGEKLADILKSRTSVSEGVHTAAAAAALARQHHVDMPITAAVDAVLNHNADLEKVIAGLLARPLKVEGI